LEFSAYLEHQLETARTLGLDQVGLPISSDSIEVPLRLTHTKKLASEHGVMMMSRALG
jgi:hypothetical protein